MWLIRDYDNEILLIVDEYHYNVAEDGLIQIKEDDFYNL